MPTDRKLGAIVRGGAWRAIHTTTVRDEHAEGNYGRANREDCNRMKFGDDWPGVFIRGDEALGYAGKLRLLLAAAEKRIAAELSQDEAELSHDEIAAWTRVGELAALLESCRAPGG